MTSITYIGMDVHTTNFTLCCYSFEDDKVYATVQVKPEYTQILKYINRIRKQRGEDTRFVCGYEAGCLGYSLYHQLTDHGVECVNLVKNALDHTAAGDQIEIKWDQAANVTRITVADNGAGIHPEDIHHIFKRFYRSRFSQDTHGLGLGLPLAKAIVETHNGNIAVDSVWGRGSTFVLCFLNTTKL